VQGSKDYCNHTRDFRVFIALQRLPEQARGSGGVYLGHDVVLFDESRHSRVLNYTSD
jgi:hypothetical protein